MAEVGKAAPPVMKAGRGQPPAKKAPPGKGKAPPPPKAGGPKCPPLPRGAANRENSRDAAIGPKMRPLFWAVVQQVGEESVFANLVPPAAFDKAQLERQFALSDSRTPMSNRNAHGPRSSSPEPRKRLRVLDDGTSQLLAIAFNKLPEPDRLAMMVDTLEDFPEGLPSEAVLALHKASTEQREAIDQIRQLAKSEADRGQLDKPERFLWVLGSVPFCSAKLACGALIVGSAHELPDLRYCAQKVGVCCKDIRHSELLKKCISTSFAVGNFLNRGTARSSCRGVVLPDSLLKLEELRGAAEKDADSAPSSARSSDTAGGGGSDARDHSLPPARGPSVLDFVAQALVNEAVMDPRLRHPDDLRVQVETLLSKARDAAGVSLEETEANCKQVAAEAIRARQSLTELPPSLQQERLMEQVHRICQEAEVAVTLAEKAKEELEKMQKWSSAKAKVKSEDWFKSWVQVLEVLAGALTRAVARASKMRPVAPPSFEAARPPLSVSSTGAEENHLQAPTAGATEANVRPGVKQLAKATSEVVFPAPVPIPVAAPLPIPIAAPAATPMHASSSNPVPAPMLSSIPPDAPLKALRQWQNDDNAKLECIDWEQIKTMRQQQQQQLQQAPATKVTKKPFRIECGDFIDSKENLNF